MGPSAAAGSSGGVVRRRAMSVPCSSVGVISLKTKRLWLGDSTLVMAIWHASAPTRAAASRSFQSPVVSKVSPVEKEGVLEYLSAAEQAGRSVAMPRRHDDVKPPSHEREARVRRGAGEA